MMRWLAAVVVALAIAPAADAKTVRVFAVGPRYDQSWVDSAADYFHKLDSMFVGLRRLGGGRDLAVLPESIGLLAALSGTRGEPARAAPDLTDAIAGLIASYAGPIAYYAGKYPQLAQRGIPTRLLSLGLTDTYGRVAVESFAALARRYGVYLAAGVDMARDWEIVCRDQATFVPPPGAQRCDAQDPALVAALGEPGAGYAYVATSPDPVNMALLFDPSGNLIAKQAKAYLTPTELPGQLDLSPGDPHDLTAIRTPVGKLGFVTSKDAWMPDVIDRLDDAGVQILVQPEFFIDDTVSRTGMWAPDTLKAGGYSDLLREPSLRAMALPSLTGDVYEFSADAQSHIAVRGGPSGELVGQDPAPGLGAVEPYLAPDPTTLPMAERRDQLGAAGDAAVGTGTQQEGVVSADVHIGRRTRHRVARRGDLPIASSLHDQRHVALASLGRHVWAAWDENGRIREAVSRDGGRTFGPARTRGRGTHPALSAAHGGWIWLAFQRADGKVVASEGGDPPRPVARGGGHQERPSIAAFADGDAYAVWVDDRTGLTGVYGAHVGDRATRLDQGTPVDLAAQLDNAWAPSVTRQHSQVLVSWVDFRAYKWDVYARLSRDHGETFAPQVRVNDSPDADEALDDTPRSSFAHGDPFVAWTDFRKRDSPLPHPLYDIAGAVPGQPDRLLDGDGGAQIDAFAPALVTLRRGGEGIAYESHRGATADIVAGRLGGRLRRVDDAGARDVNSWRPAIARSARRVVVAWEDDRDGPSNIFRRVLSLPSATSP
jgi:hypothetical protein